MPVSPFTYEEHYRAPEYVGMRTASRIARWVWLCAVVAGIIVWLIFGNEFAVLPFVAFIVAGLPCSFFIFSYAISYPSKEDNLRYQACADWLEEHYG